MRAIGYNRLLLLPADPGAFETCERIVVDIPGAGVASPDSPKLEGADLRIGGIIVVGSENALREARSIADRIRTFARLVETLPIGWFGSREKAVRYGRTLAESMLLLLEHQAPTAVICRSAYEKGSRWLDDEAESMLFQ